MKTLIIGYGEIGKSLAEVLGQHYELDVCDIDTLSMVMPEIMHICFPYSDKFIKEVKRYQKLYKSKYIVIHSTVPVGTSKKCNAIHSPVVGLHPFLQESIKTFTKFLGGKDADKVADYFRRANIKVYLTDKSETTELMKVLSTTYHGLTIEYTKEVKKQCDKYNVPFELWTLWNRNYNDGYETLGHPEYKRPDLIPVMKKIGGHCVLSNLEFLDSKFTEFIGELNET